MQWIPSKARESAQNTRHRICEKFALTNWDNNETISGNYVFLFHVLQNADDGFTKVFLETKENSWTRQ